MLLGQRILLEAVEHSSIEQLRVWRNNPYLRKFFREYREISVEMQSEWYKKISSGKDKNNIYFQIKSSINGSEQLIGCCGILNINWVIRTGELSIYVAKDRRRGFGSEALKVLCDYGFKELCLHKIHGEVYDNNDAISIYTGAGFRKDGLMRDTYIDNGKYGNSYIISILEGEWVKRYGEDVLWKTGQDLL